MRELRQQPLFVGVSDEESRCLEGGEEVYVQADEILAREGDPGEYFFVLLEGEVRITKRYGRQAITMATHTAGKFFGEVSLLLEIPFFVDAHVLKPSRLLRFQKDTFLAMMRQCPSVAKEILRTMATRLRNLEGFSHQREKFISLGTMAAGLAHELNNPVSAARRAAVYLDEAVDALQRLACQLYPHLTALHWECLVTAATTAERRTTELASEEPLAGAEREQRITTWLDEHEVPESWKLSAALAAAAVAPADLDKLYIDLPKASVASAIEWLGTRLNIRALLREMDHSTHRIAGLVDTVKSYSYEGQGPRQTVDIHDGLEATLKMLEHKLKDTTVLRDYDRSLPSLEAYGLELNQVWTNLIDNAIDALHPQGHIWIRTRQEDHQIIVEIQDDGAGIPEEIQPRLFEPFFTTKGVGKGTGFGLIICYRIVTNRHGGEIEFVSKPGETRFLVRLPMTTRTTASHLLLKDTADLSSTDGSA